ncbi:YggS family pyridoxal phosphate-dependent enzyme [Congzhengia minquanensis]|uniref:Pyridoxal phosphate homeostasis protein n=1 Tax=Congzhengia minquanensis TaxID=2763657 RepID=A0A926HZW8_9FIRM|nr:YggS family pyridoxal phosphate-dependent enzyme [Congzhengia minquanensis]MBC8541296.1 YggS family pyridoxal phosphate-dependent enzyme [Congzhengia minquanensis]
MIQDNVKRVMEEIARAAATSGRKPEDITLVGVTKTVTAVQAKELIDAGVTNLGENRVQSLLDKYETLKDEPAWHLIGHLQTNKVKYIADKVSMIHSVDSLKLAEEIDRRFQMAGRTANILVQVNVSGEESKFGIQPEDAFPLMESLSQLKNIQVCGLMTMAPKTDHPDDCRKFFYGLHKLSVDIRGKKYDNINMGQLSMGMSGDFREAILEGATIVRIGSALFQ